MILECCVDSVASALAAKKGGADRLELCANLVIGGTTPTLSLYECIRERSNMRIHALIRPRFGDFLYSDEEFMVILKEVDQFREAGADGVVIGCLNDNGTLCLEQMKTLISHCGSMHVTLHRAFDMCRDPFEALEQAIALGIHTILTSGQQPSCAAGADLLKQLHNAAGKKLTVMAGAGVNEETVRLLLEKTSLQAFHMSGKKIVESKMQFRNPLVSMGIPGMSEYEIWQTEQAQIAAVKHLLR